MKNRAGLDFAVVIQLSYKYRMGIVFGDAFSLQNITFGSMESLFCLFLDLIVRLCLLNFFVMCISLSFVFSFLLMLSFFLYFFSCSLTS